MNKQAFTIIEILIAMTITVILTLIINDFLITGFRSSSFNYDLQDAVDQARKAMDVMTIEMRGINYSEKGDYPIAQIATNTFVFYNDIDKDGKRERIKYYLSDTSLKKDVVRPDASNNYSTATSTSIVASYINNYPNSIFTYYDSSESTTSIIGNIRMVNIFLEVDVNPAKSPQKYDIQSDVLFRNLKDN